MPPAPDQQAHALAASPGACLSGADGTDGSGDRLAAIGDRGLVEGTRARGSRRRRAGVKSSPAAIHRQGRRESGCSEKGAGANIHFPPTRQVRSTSGIRRAARAATDGPRVIQLADPRSPRVGTSHHLMVGSPLLPGDNHARGDVIAHASAQNVRLVNATATSAILARRADFREASREVSAVRRVDEAPNKMYNQMGSGKKDIEYLSCPRWSKVIEAVMKAYRLLYAGLKMEGTPSCLRTCGPGDLSNSQSLEPKQEGASLIAYVIGIDRKNRAGRAVI